VRTATTGSITAADAALGRNIGAPGTVVTSNWSCQTQLQQLLTAAAASTNWTGTRDDHPATAIVGYGVRAEVRQRAA